MSPIRGTVHRTCLNSVKTKKISLGLRKEPREIFLQVGPLGQVLTLYKRPVCCIDTQLAELCFTTFSSGDRVLAWRKELSMLTETRYQHLMWLWENETNDEETQEWRDELDQEEQELVDRWDNGFYDGLCRIYQDLVL